MCVVDARADVLDDWTDQVDAIAADRKLPPPLHARLLALVHVSMFEAVNAIERRYAPYALDLVADRKTSREAAIAAAGHAALAAEFPDQVKALDARLAQSLAVVETGPARDRGVLLGRRAAADLRERRMPDGTEIAETYRPVTAPGLYVPTG